MVHSILGLPLVPLEWLVLEVLVSESIRVSPTVVAVATVVTATPVTFVITAASAVIAVLWFGAATVTSVTISIPIATKISPTPSGIAVPTVVLVASPTASGTTCRRKKCHGQLNYKPITESHLQNPCPARSITASAA